MTLKDALLKRITTSRLDIGLNLAIFNPNTYTLPVQAVDWKLNLFRSPFTDGSTAFKHNIGPQSRSTVEVPLGITYSAARVGVQNLLTKRSIPWGVDGGCTFRTPAGPIRVAFGQDGSWQNPLLK